MIILKMIYNLLIYKIIQNYSEPKFMKYYLYFLSRNIIDIFHKSKKDH